jgi:hypothetical protein
VSLVQDDGILICSLLSARHTTANKGANNRAIIPFDNNRSIELMRLSDTGETEKERKRERERERERESGGIDSAFSLGKRLSLLPLSSSSYSCSSTSAGGRKSIKELKVGWSSCN